MSQIHDISQAQGLDYWKKRAHQAEDKCAEMAQEIYIVEQLASNPNITDKEKIDSIVYYQWYINSIPARPNGARYYSAQQLATRLGSPRTEKGKPSPGEQAFSPVHTKLKKAGLISITTEAQKNDKSRKNLYDLMLPQFTLSAGSFSFEKEKKERGGRRVALHRECGGLCVERTTYACMKCGHGNIDKEYILMVDEEKYESWKEDGVPCAHCAQPLPVGIRFCPGCGCDVSAPAPDVEETPGPADESIQLDFTTPGAGAHPRGIACPDCNSFTDWLPVPTEWGGFIHVCGKCFPDYMSA